ncbi:MAG: NrdH-redoxin [Actinomycetota bacterium]
MGLGSSKSKVTWVNIWQDPEAAAFVTTYRDGNETVPTAVTGSGTMLDADADTIKAHLAATADQG